MPTSRGTDSPHKKTRVEEREERRALDKHREERRALQQLQAERARIDAKLDKALQNRNALELQRREDKRSVWEEESHFVTDEVPWLRPESRSLPPSRSLPQLSRQSSQPKPLVTQSIWNHHGERVKLFDYAAQVMEVRQPVLNQTMSSLVGSVDGPEYELRADGLGLS